MDGTLGVISLNSSPYYTYALSFTAHLEHLHTIIIKYLTTLSSKNDKDLPSKIRSVSFKILHKNELNPIFKASDI